MGGEKLSYHMSLIVSKVRVARGVDNRSKRQKSEDSVAAAPGCVRNTERTNITPSSTEIDTEKTVDSACVLQVIEKGYPPLPVSETEMRVLGIICENVFIVSNGKLEE